MDSSPKNIFFMSEECQKKKELRSIYDFTFTSSEWNRILRNYEKIEFLIILSPLLSPLSLCVYDNGKMLSPFWQLFFCTRRNKNIITVHNIL